MPIYIHTHPPPTLPRSSDLHACPSSKTLRFPAARLAPAMPAVRIVRNGGRGVPPPAPARWRARPHQTKAVCAHWQRLPLRRRPLPTVLPLHARRQARPCQCVRFCGCGRAEDTTGRRLVGPCALRHRRARSGDAPAHTRARSAPAWRRVPAGAVRIVRSSAACGRAAHRARDGAQGSWTARSTPTPPARRASRRSSPRRRAPVRPAYSAGGTVTVGRGLPTQAAASTTAAPSTSTLTRRAHPPLPTRRCVPVNPPPNPQSTAVNRR